jgi:predicted  nucleic acid-binding Zn-ribbon protein
MKGEKETRNLDHKKRAIQEGHSQLSSELEEAKNRSDLLLEQSRKLEEEQAALQKNLSKVKSEDGRESKAALEIQIENAKSTIKDFEKEKIR